MKILLVGNGHSVFISQLAENLIKKGILVNVLDINKLIYKKHNGQNLYLGEGKFYRGFLKIPKIRLISKKIIFYRFVKYNYKLFLENDVINFHYLDTIKRNIIKLLVNKAAENTKKIIISIWGSDFYRANDAKRKADISCYENSKIITFTNEETLKEFQGYYNHKFDSKCKTVSFGLQPIVEIASLSKLEPSFLKIKGIDLNVDKIKILVGYNASRGQQHLVILKFLKKLPNEILSKVFFIFHLGYGGSRWYKFRIAHSLAGSGINYKILPDLLSYKEVAKLRILCDILLNLQLTDQCSGSMAETLFAKNIVITGKWLPYNVLLKKGIYMERINNLSELNEKLAYVVNNFSILKNRCEKNSEIIWQESMWKTNIKKWIEIYSWFFM